MRSLTLSALLLVPSPLASQLSSHVWIDATGQSVRAKSDLGSTHQTFSGVAVGGEGGVRVWRFDLDIGYWEGRLTSPVSGVLPRTLAEGRALLGIRPLGWLVVRAGPHARSYASDAGVERWLFWEGRLRVSQYFVGSSVQGFVELWQAFSGDVNLGGGGALDNARGGEAGMVLAPRGAPLWVRLGYGIDRSRLGNGRLETAERLAVAVGLWGGGGRR